MITIETDKIFNKDTLCFKVSLQKKYLTWVFLNVLKKQKQYEMLVVRHELKWFLRNILGVIFSLK